MGSPLQPNHRGSPLDRLLRLFTEVRAGEGASAVLLAGNVFLILTAYSVLKVLREPLILAGGGAEVRSYSAAGQALLLLIAVPAYGVLASRMPRRRLINLVTYFFVACLGLFFALGQLDVPLGIPFFLWVGIFNVMIVAQFWGFANDVYTNEEGKRLFPIVGFGASAGAVFGAWLAGILISNLGLFVLMVVAAALLVLALAITNLIDSRERRRTEASVPDVMASGVIPAATNQIRTRAGLEAPDEEHRQASGTFTTIKRGAKVEEADEVPGSTGSAFALVFRNRYLLLIALLVMTLNWVNTTGEYMLAETVYQAAASDPGADQEAFIGLFYARFQFGVNLLGLLVQLFIVSRVIKYLGVRVALLILPLIALGGNAIFVFVPILGIIRWTKTAENATDYSLNNTVRNVLFLPTTREEKYKAKQAIDSFFHRAGDVLQAALVFVGLNYLAFETRHFAMVNMGLVLVWLLLAFQVGLRYRRLAATTEKGSVTA